MRINKRAGIEFFLLGLGLVTAILSYVYIVTYYNVQSAIDYEVYNEIGDNLYYESELLKGKNEEEIIDTLGRVYTRENYIHTFLIDGSGNVLFHDDSSIDLFDFIDGEQVEKDYKNNPVGIYKLRDENYAAFSKISNDLVLFNTATSSEANLYHKNVIYSLKGTLIYVSGAFIITTIFLLAFAYLREKRYIRNDEELRFMSDRNDIVMQEMKNGVIDYDVIYDEVNVNSLIVDKFKGLNGMKLHSFVKLWSIRHPEFKSDYIISTIHKVLETGQSDSFESFVNFDNDVRWYRFNVVPYRDADGTITHLFGSAINITEEHARFVDSADMLSFAPGGFHRCDLNYPIHLDFASDSLIQMLGYTREEFENKINRNKYSLVVYEEDRDKFVSFAQRLAEEPMIDSCEYRMIKKDGTLLEVVDTMESVRNEDGRIYGYSIVVDSEWVNKQRNENLIALSEAQKQIEEVSREKRIMESIADTLVNDYDMLFYIDLNDDSYIQYSKDEKFSSFNIQMNGTDFFESTKRNIEMILHEEDKMKIALAMQKESIIQGLNDDENYSFTYRVMLDGKELYYQMKAAYPPEDKEHLIVCLKDVNEEITKELERDRQKAEINNLQEMLTLSRIRNSTSQMQPHFLYNALGSIREIIMEDPDYASELIVDFTTHLRACVRSLSNDNLIPFKEEIANVKAYVNIEKMRFGDKLQVFYDLDYLDFDIVPLSIQPLVENAIRHGIYKKGMKDGVVRVSSVLEGDIVTVKVSDNGSGFDPEKIQQEVDAGIRDSTGLANMRFRLEKMMNANVHIDSKESVGTVVSIIFNLSDQQKADETESEIE